MNKKYIALATTVLITFLIALGQILWKVGADDFNLSIEGILFNLPVLAGFFLYGTASILLIVALKYGNLSLVHPILSLGFVWGAIMAYFYLGESINLLKIAGMGCIIGGAVYISRGDR